MLKIHEFNQGFEFWFSGKLGISSFKFQKYILFIIYGIFLKYS